MVIGIELGSANINFVGFGNNIFKIIEDHNSEEDIFILTQGSVPIGGDIQKAIDILMDRLVTCNVNYVGFNKNIGSYKTNHIKNIEKLRNTFFADCSSIIDIGSKNTIIHTFDGNKLCDTYTNGKCAAGSGSFIETMADRLNLSLNNFIKLAKKTEEYVSLSGRCAVFCESDIVHLFQKGITKDRIAHGITRNVALNVQNILGKDLPGTKALFVGGVSKNEAVLKDLNEIFPNTNIETCRYPFNAFATVFSAVETNKKELKEFLLNNIKNESYFQTDKPLVLLSKPKDFKNKEIIKNKHFESVALGLDIGSVSTKGAIITKINDKPEILSYYYRKTEGNPIIAVKDVIEKIHNDLKEKNITFDKCYGGTTGSGRYLTGDFIGADLIKNEITAQVAGTVCLYPEADTIFEIGGQDSKYISIKDGEITDFEMNKVCAAGTGAFLEKQAKILAVSIEDFGDLALKSKKPPILDHNCTIYTEIAMKNSLTKYSKEDLAAAVCMASARNYINKNVENRKIGNKIVFSGAVAFNKGIVAAFETLINKEIYVSQYPHINGAIGIAWLSLKEEKESAEFKGFENILKQKYTLSSFRCKGCNNFCDVSVFETKDKKFYYNDRCEKYSGKKQNNYQADLFERYKELIEENLERVPELDKKETVIGYPRGMFFNEYYPLFGPFFKACGFKVVLSDETNKTIAETGSLLAGTKPCFPFKTAFGHFNNILSKNCDFIFLPRIINGEISSSKNTHYCPYMQAGCDIIVQRNKLKGIQNNLDRPIEKTDKIISPTFYMAEGANSIKSILIELGKAMGAKQDIIKKAADIAYDAWLDFKDDLAYTGKNILDLYKGYIYVILGHPYVLYDKYLNMNIGEKITKMGYMPIPMDFIPYKGQISYHVYQKEIEKKLSLGSYLKNHNDIKTIVLSYFACGMDAFSNKFYKEELEHPCYIMNLDEHTSDAGVQTRIEAFADIKQTLLPNTKQKIKTTDLNKIKDKILWLPVTDFSSEILAKAFNLFGIKAKVLDESANINFEEARKVISEDVCLPCLATMEDMINRINAEDFDPEKEAFFQAGANGPCRLGMYPERQKLAITTFKKGKDIPVSIINNNYFKCGLDINFAILTWNGLIVHDMLIKLLLHTRPYETVKGRSEQIYNKYCSSITNSMKTALNQIKRQKFINFENIPIFDAVLKDACEEFNSISDHSIKKPVIGITGEFYIKLNERSNRYIVDYLEEKGFEVCMSTLTEYFNYSNYITLCLTENKIKNLKGIDKLKTFEYKSEEFIRKQAQKIIDKRVVHYNSIISPFTEGLTEISSKELVRKGSRFLHLSVTGEAITQLGKAVDFFEKEVCGIINIAPFNCMPGGITDLLGESFRKEHENIPFISLYYDGYEDNYDRIDNFIAKLT